MRRCLAVIDFQNDFIDGSLGSEAARAVVHPVVDKIRARRAEGWDVIFTLDTHDEDYLQTAEGKNLPVVHCVKGTHGHALCREAETERRPEDLVIEKPAFGSAELFEYFRKNSYDEIELVGLVTDICVLANAVLAKTARPEANVHVDASCTASSDPKRHEEALDVMQGLQIGVDRTLSAGTNAPGAE